MAGFDGFVLAASGIHDGMNVDPKFDSLSNTPGGFVVVSVGKMRGMYPPHTMVHPATVASGTPRGVVLVKNGVVEFTRVGWCTLSAAGPLSSF